MRAMTLGLAAALLVGAPSYGQTPTRNPWAEQYKTRTPEAMAAQFESESRAVYRYRVAIAALLQLKPGMVGAESGAGSGFVSRVRAG